MNLSKALGPDCIRRIITAFYIRAFDDVIIGHLFVGKDRLKLTEAQIEFTSGLLGAGIPYTGRPLASVHEPLDLRGPHFDRRRILMMEVMTEEQVDQEIMHRWLEREDRLRGLILGQPG